jgi:tetratricopeptide (TPR) repeat protein
MVYQFQDKKDVLEELSEKSLSEILDKIESGLVKIKGSGEKAENLLFFLDEASSRIDSAKGAELKAEKAQLDYLISATAKNAWAVLIELGGPKRLAALRDQYHPDFSQSWWHLDQYLIDQGKKNLKKTIYWVGGVVIVLLVLGLVYQRFLAPSPAVVGEFNHERNAQDAVINGDLNTALSETDKALAYSPNNSELMILKGIVLQKLGKVGDADKIFQDVEKILGSRENFLQARALLYIQANDGKSALVDGQEITKLNPDSAEGYYYSSLAYSDLKMINQAIDAFNKASDLAEKQKKTVLLASIRVNLAMALQNAQIEMPTEMGTTTPAP